MIIVDEIQDKLNELWAGVVDFYEIDILKHLIKFNITVLENGERTSYCILFKGVSSYHFYEDSQERRLNPIEPDEGDYSELTSINFIKNGIGNIKIEASTDRWVEQYYSNANFVLEIWNSMLFIEAKYITINGVEYEVKYPNII